VVTTLNAGAADAPDLDPGAYPVRAGQNAFDKWLRASFSADVGGFNRVSNFKLWASPTPPGVLLKGHVGGPGGDLGYAAPSQADIAQPSLPQGEGAALTLGPLELTSDGDTHYIHVQIQTAAAASAGDQPYYLNFRYDEE